MAIIITSECINCGACEPECPNNAIYEGGAEWRWGDGTKLTKVDFGDGEIIDAAAPQSPVPPGPLGADGSQYYYIVPDKCTECVGFHEEPQCAAVCPVDCCVPDPENVEDKDALLKKKQWLHGG